MIYLPKILPLFLLPVGITLILVLTGFFLRRRALIVGGVVVLWVSSTPAFSVLAIRAAEGFAERGQATDAPAANAIVVLSEGRVIAPGGARISEWDDADRFFGGVDLFKAGRAPFLVFTGGVSHWEPDATPEGEILARYATSMEVPEAQILKTSRASNTAEEAQAVIALLRGRFAGHPHVLLVTSAFHMARARFLFERNGMVVLPFPVDFKVSTGRTISVLNFMPSGEGLQQTELAMREIYGRLYYAVIR